MAYKVLLLLIDLWNLNKNVSGKEKRNGKEFNATLRGNLRIEVTIWSSILNYIGI